MAKDEYDDGDAYREERENFTALIAKNPNYFGTLAAAEEDFPAEADIQGNTYYEELTCVAFNQRLDILEATVAIKREFGYGTDLCGPGTTEYVRFYVDYGAGWIDVGLSAFNSHDIPTYRDCEQEPNKPLTYVVQHPLDPERDDCKNPVLPRVRAILSWQMAPPPGSPNWIQVWGNTMDRHVQIRPTLLIPPVVKEPGLAEIAEMGEETAAEGLSLEELAELYHPEVLKEKGLEPVESWRFGMNSILDALKPGGNPEAVYETAEKFAELGLDWQEAVAGLEETSGNVGYEELLCLGLDRNTDWLIASYVIKREAGYSGDLCTKGSREYVAFWADFGDECRWKYLGTRSLPAHDIAPLPKGGLHYWIGIKVDLSDFQRECEEPLVGRVRAVLSWNTPPSDVDPHEVPYWGNRVDRHVEIKPRSETPVGDEIDVIGGVSVSNIETGTTGRTVPNAVFAQSGGFTDVYVPSRQCPFGGSIHVNAAAPASHASTGQQYRLLYRQAPTVSNPAPSEIPITDKFWVSSGSGGYWRYPDPTTGWLPYIPPGDNVYNVLGWWKAGGLASVLHEIKLERANSSMVVIASTAWLKVDVDNTKPTAAIAIDPALGGACTDITQGTTVTGTFVARDDNFGHYTLATTPSSLTPPPPAPTPSSGNTQTPLAGAGWSLNTASMQVCGYVVTVRVWDRTIVNSAGGTWNHNYDADDVGFCLRAP